MRSRSRSLGLVALTLVVAACGGPGFDDDRAFASSGEALSQPTVAAVEDGDVTAQLVALVSKARHTVDLVEFEYVFTDARVRPLNAALEAAVARHVRVRALLDPGVTASRAAIAKLRALGVDAKLGTSGMKVHNKFVVVDASAFVAGSTNFSSASLTKNHETDVVVRLRSAAGALERYFEALWSSPGTAQLAPSTRSTVVQVLGDGQYAAQAKAAIDAARSHVELLMYAAGYSEGARPDNLRNGLVDSLAAAARRGVAVRVVLERGYARSVLATDNQQFAAHLAGTGVEIRFDPPSVTTHAKLLVADSVALTGSTNWTASALADYHATDVRVRRASVANAFRSYFDGVWATSTP